MRELASQALLAGYAALKGFRVYIGTKFEIADIIQFEGFGPLKYMRFIDKKCDAVAVLDQEIVLVVEKYKGILKLLWKN